MKRIIRQAYKELQGNHADSKIGNDYSNIKTGTDMIAFFRKKAYTYAAVLAVVTSPITLPEVPGAVSDAYAFIGKQIKDQQALFAQYHNNKPTSKPGGMYISNYYLNTIVSHIK